MRRRVVTAVAVLLLLIGVALAGRRMVERVPVTIRRGASLEVRRQPRLAFERMLAAGGADVRRVPLAAGQVRGLAAGGVLFVAQAGSALSRDLGDQLSDWVNRGGTLVLSPRDDDAGGGLAERLGVRTRTGGRGAPWPGVDLSAPERITATLPGRLDRFVLRAGRGFLLDGPAAWTVGDGHGGLTLAVLQRGRGRIVIVAELASLWSNDGIGDDDHAALLWAIATIDGRDRPVILTDLAEPEVTWGALARRGWPVVTAGAVLALLALWRVLPRMGPVLAPASPERRQLREHLQALGRFHMRHDRYADLTSHAQRALEHQLRRQPWLRRAGDDAALAAQPATPSQFLSTIQRLHALWRRLHRA